ncbi:MvaI/BcnI family restriction endonuclease [Brevibacillus sp. SYSU BS000544]|uniref:MvaI/BcnI family restriction endonuclease n=1 Tax=Brevibacillus sp. SYSU BS000544 TaxID=3416443 RepID=UPI003CE44CCA
MNPYFLPDIIEQKLIQIIQKYCRNDFSLIRMTETMLKKSIIDASDSLRVILRDNEIVNYGEIKQEEKLYKAVTVFNKGDAISRDTSFYRPKTKSGDPRFWISRFTHFVNVGQLVYFTVYRDELIAIPLIGYEHFEDDIRSFFGADNTDDQIIEELRQKISLLKARGWIESTSPYKSNPKDAGETLEQCLGISANSLISADYMGEIELKTKRANSGNRDTLFSMIPDWENSTVKSSTDMMLKYGYPSRKYEGFQDLYVTVNNNPNNQGLFMGVDDAKEQVFQHSLVNGIEEEACIWGYSDVKRRLLEKHPKTMWIIAEEKVFDGKIHFNYVSVELTQRPIFTQFTSLIQQGLVVYDWRGRVRIDRTGYKDKGHCFRMNPRDRHLLFGETKMLEI